jgi:ribosomal protein S6
MIKQLEREYRLNENLLRYKTILLNKAALKSLASRTASKAKAAPAEKEKTPKTEKPQEAETPTPEKEKTAK